MDTSQNQFLTKHTEHGVVVLTFTKPTLNADAVMEALTVINADNSRKVILDFQTVRFLVGGSLLPDQEPVTPLWKLSRQLTEEGGRLVLCNVAPEIVEVIRVIRLDRIIEILPDANAAMECLARPTEKTTSKYSHTQKAPLYLLVYALAAVFLALGWIVQDAPTIPWLFPPIGLLMLVVAASFHHLKVEDQGDVLSVRFGPIPLFRKTVQYSDIVKVEVGRTLLLDGLGIHMSIRGGWVWNLWGRDCVVLYLNKGTLRIGTNDAENLAAFLRSRVVT